MNRSSRRGRCPRWLAAVATAGALAGCDAKLPDPDSPGARLYAERCGGCHRLYAPGSMTAEMWRVQVERMHGDMARQTGATLSHAETALLMDYLRQHSH